MSKHTGYGVFDEHFYASRFTLRLLPNSVKHRESHDIPPGVREYVISNRI